MTSETRTLLLTQGYEPIQIISWQRAITLLALDKVEVVEEYDAAIRAASIMLRVPAVVRLRKLFHRAPKPVKFSRVNIYARDSYRCQYCGMTCGVDELTYDHVVPRSKGGRTVWANVVTACAACNLFKGNRLPQQSGMYPRTRPVRPTTYMLQQNGRAFPPNYLHHSWRDYLYWDTELDPA